jgi:hypothetical protein
MMLPSEAAGLMAEYAQDAADTARDKFQIDLDYSLESIDSLNIILQAQFDAMPTGWQLLYRFRPSKRKLRTWSKMWGGYLGEVIRREWGGQWVEPADGPFKGGVTLLVQGTMLSPIARAHKQLVNGADASVAAYVASLIPIFSRPAG